MEQDERLGIGAINFWNGAEPGRMNDGKLRFMLLNFFQGLHLNKHVPGEEIMPSVFIDDPDVHLVGGYGPGIAILDENVFILEISLQPMEKCREAVFFDPYGIPGGTSVPPETMPVGGEMLPLSRQDGLYQFPY